MAAKKAAKKVASLPLKAIPIFGWAMAAYDVYDVVSTGVDVYDMVKEYNAAADALCNLAMDNKEGCYEVNFATSTITRIRLHFATIQRWRLQITNQCCTWLGAVSM